MTSGASKPKQRPCLSERYRVVATLERLGAERRLAVENVATGVPLIARVWPVEVAPTALFARARQAALLRNGHTVRTLDVEARAPGKAFVVQERVDGDPLDVSWAEGRLAPGEALVLASQLLGSLAEAHRHGLVHGDLHPRHVAIVEEGTGPWAKVGGYEDGLGTPPRAGAEEWAAPECIKGRPPTVASDLYTAGLLFFRAVFGHSFRAEEGDVLTATYRRMKSGPLRSDDPLWDAPGLEAFFHRALAPVPGQRFASAGEMQQSLRRIALPTGGSASWPHCLVREITKPVPSSPTSERARRRPTVWLLGDDMRVSEGALRRTVQEARAWLEVRVVRDVEIGTLTAELDTGNVEVPWVLLFGEFRDATKPLRDRIASQRETTRMLVGAEDNDLEWLSRVGREGLDGIVEVPAQDGLVQAALQRALERTETLLQTIERLRVTYVETKERAHLLSRMLARKPDV